MKTHPKVGLLLRNLYQWNLPDNGIHIQMFRALHKHLRVNRDLDGNDLHLKSMDIYIKPYVKKNIVNDHMEGW